MTWPDQTTTAMTTTTIMTTWRPLGDHMATTWRPRPRPLGDHLETIWETLGDHLATTWRPLGDYLATTWLTSCSMNDAESAQFTPSSFPKFLKCENDQNLILQKSSPFHHVRALKSNKILNISLFDLVRVPNPLSQTYPGLAFCFKEWHKTAIFPSCRNWPIWPKLHIYDYFDLPVWGVRDPYPNVEIEVNSRNMESNLSAV